MYNTVGRCQTIDRFVGKTLEYSNVKCMWNVDYLGLSAALVIMCIILWSWLVLLSSRRHQMTWSLSVKHLHYLVLLLSKRQKGKCSSCQKDRDLYERQAIREASIKANLGSDQQLCHHWWRQAFVSLSRLKMLRGELRLQTPEYVAWLSRPTWWGTSLQKQGKHSEE